MHSNNGTLPVANGNNATVLGSAFEAGADECKDTGSVEYINGLSSFGKAEVSVCCAVACTGACLYVILIGSMVRRRLPYSYVTLASTLTALFPVYEALICLAIFVPKSAEFMHILMAAYAMMTFNDLANLLAFKFGAIRFILGRGCTAAHVEDYRMMAVHSRPLWSRVRLLATRALIRQGKLLHCLDVALSAALLLNAAAADSRHCRHRRLLRAAAPTTTPGAGDLRQWLRACVLASRLVASAAAAAMVARCCRSRPGLLLPGYRLAAKFAAVAAINAAHLALGAAACAANWAGIAAAGDVTLHVHFGLLLAVAGGQVWSLAQFGCTPGAPRSPLQSSAAAAAAYRQKLLQSPPLPPPLSSLHDPSPIVAAAVDDSVPSASVRGGGSGHCAACARLLASSDSRGLVEY